MTLESNLKVTDSLGDLLEVQRASFKSFLEVGLPEELNNFSPVRDYTGRLELFFMGSNYRFKLPKISSDINNEYVYAWVKYIGYTIIKTIEINKNSPEVGTP